MQDIQSISSTARILGDRRLRPHAQYANHQQALKCPRCDSLNTKFCYYNNYNLSQPRHFCKSCRRYWTKGGVLRNVPVGGGCRKSKRSSKPKPVKSGSGKGIQSQSSSDSSNNHGNGDNCNNNTITTPASAATGMSSNVCGGLFQISDTQKMSLRNLDPLFEKGADDGRGVLYGGELGGFVNLMDNNSVQQQLQLQQHQDQDQMGLNGLDDCAGAVQFNQFSAIGVDDWGFGKIDDQEIGGIDDMLQNRGNSGGLHTLDWNQTAANGHQTFFDTPTTIDHQPYWTHSNPTIDHHHHAHCSQNSNHHSLFLP